MPPAEDRAGIVARLEQALQAHQDGLGSETVSKRLLRDALTEIRRLERQCQQIAALQGYVQHKSSCRSYFRREFCRHHGGDGGTNGCPDCQGLPRRPECTCGLDALHGIAEREP